MNTNNLIVRLNILDNEIKIKSNELKTIEEILKYSEIEYSEEFSLRGKKGEYKRYRNWIIENFNLDKKKDADEIKEMSNKKGVLKTYVEYVQCELENALINGIEYLNKGSLEISKEIEIKQLQKIIDNKEYLEVTDESIACTLEKKGLSKVYDAYYFWGFEKFSHYGKVKEIVQQLEEKETIEQYINYLKR